MYRKGLIIFFLLLLCVGRAMAFDFSVPMSGGNTLYFSYVEGGVAVVHPNTSAVPAQVWSGYPRPVGAVTIPSTVVHNDVEYNVVAVSDYAFFGCSDITSLTVGEGVEMLCASSFRSCSALTSVSLPSTMDTIGNYVFYDCTDLQSVAVQSLVPPRCAAGAFFEDPLYAATLTVPHGSTTAYSTVVPWSSFGTIVEAIFDVTIAATANSEQRGSVEGGGTYTYGTSVELVATPAEGCFFACWDDGDTLNPRMVTADENRSFVALFFAMQHDSVPVPVYDTVVVHDTVTTIVVHVDTVDVHDTVTMVVVHVDTVVVYDTVTTIVVHVDTVDVHDTVTTVVVQVDTVVVHDTVTVTHTEIDTVYITDTVTPTFFRLTDAAEGGGVGVGNGLLPAGTVAEIGALPTEGNRFVRWSDGGSDNPRTVTLTGNMTFTAVFETLGVHVVDQGLPWTAVAEGGDIVVSGVSGRHLRIFSVDGRQLYSASVESEAVRFRCAAGVYLLSVDGGAARKVVTTKH